MWVHRTKKGTIKYDRPKNRFTWCDARRIARSLDFHDIYSFQDFVCIIEIWQKMASAADFEAFFAFARAYPDAIVSLLGTLGLFIEKISPEGFSFSFSGGKFGGAGVTR